MKHIVFLIIALLPCLNAFASVGASETKIETETAEVIRPEWWIDVMKDVKVDLPSEIEAKRAERGYLEFSDLLEAKCSREKVKQVNEAIERSYLEFMNTSENKDKLKTVIFGAFRKNGYPQKMYKSHNGGKYFSLIDINLENHPDIARDVRNIGYLSPNQYDVVIFEAMVLIYRYSKSIINGALVSLKSGGKLVITLPKLRGGEPLLDLIQNYRQDWDKMEESFEDKWLFEPISYGNAETEMPVINFGKDGDKFFGGTVYSRAKEFKGVDFSRRWSDFIRDKYFEERKELIWKLFEDLGVDMTQMASLEVTKVKSGSDLYPRQKETAKDVAVLVITKK